MGGSPWQHAGRGCKHFFCGWPCFSLPLIETPNPHSSFARRSGDVKCWGRNDDGQLASGNTVQLGDGPGEMGDNLSAIDLGTGRTAVSIAGKQTFFCAVLDNDDIVCWGDNSE